MASLKSNLLKRIERLPKPATVSGALQPLFEAVSNSIHSVQHRYDDAVATLGQITIVVNLFRKKDAFWITIQDNGHGLDNRNYEAFTTTDTDNKIAIGGKGVGRLLWLDCFLDISVDSVFKDGDVFFRRKFDFILDQEEQIQNYSLVSDESVHDAMFFVRFSGLRDNGYLKKFPGRKEFIFQHFTSHFLPTLISGRCPNITIVCGDTSRTYPDSLSTIVRSKKDGIQVETDEYETLKLALLECEKTASSDLKGNHFIHFIAHDRTVVSQCIDAKLGLKYFGDDNQSVFHGILTGEYLDRNVNQERTDFLFEDATLERIVSDIWNHVADFLATPLSKLHGEQQQKIAAITESYPSVAFGDVVELQARIPSGELSEDAIFGHLSRERFRRDQRQGEKIRVVLQKLKNSNADISGFVDAIKEAREAIEEAEQKSLAEYVIRRKVVLDMIEILLQSVRHEKRDSSYQREDILHSMICPVRVNTLDDGQRRIDSAASHDLWIIDERLTFAQYFSSDTEFSLLSSAIDSEERADVLVFDHVHGLRQTDQPSRILLVEFKRPGRTEYNDDENPQMQVEKYVKKLLAGGCIDVRGRPITINRDAVFYCFIIADIVGKLEDWTYSWQRTADGRGRILQPRHGFNGIVELIGWDALLTDAKERNKAFFDHAGLSGRSVFSE
ncbi:ATP-binding protein [Mongoliimonas terrestris]|uniref:ATP-binding protein n=1 Tax=Mongoliimonas terrestris TaxID=1709001 RepID=UPI000A5C7555|nr:ATP-binding protein [Mongoliimonas terrestris]